MRMQSITTAFLLAEITPDKPDMQVCAAPMTATGKGFVEMYLAAGLPLTSFGRDKKAFQDYLCRGGKPVSFRYEGQDYAVTISNIFKSISRLCSSNINDSIRCDLCTIRQQANGYNKGV